MSIPSIKMRTSRLRLTVGQRLNILEEYEKGADVNMLAVEYGTDDLRIASVLEAKDRLKNFTSNCVDYAVRVNMIRPKFEKLDHALHEWFQNQRKNGKNVTEKMLRKQALSLHKSIYIKGERRYFNASRSWIKNFKKRFEIPNMTTRIKLHPKTDIVLNEDILSTQNINLEEFGKMSWDLDVNEIDMNVINMVTPEPALKTYSRFPKKMRPANLLMPFWCNHDFGVDYR